MTITRQDLVIIKSADMTDNDTGGGLPSKEIVINNKSNEIFDDVSDLQATMGGVSLRKVFVGVMTDNNDKLMASRMVITELPTNPNVSVFMFGATQWADTRKDAEIKLTSYLSLGSKWAGHLLENQLKGQQMIQMSLDADDDIPQVGDSVALVQNEGQTDEYQQFIHVMKVDTTSRKFQITQGSSPITVTRTVATLQISEPLRYSFNGLTVQEFYANQATTRRAVVHSTQVANANKIYSAGKLVNAIAAMTTKQVQIDSIFTQVVPASTVETALPLLSPVGQSTALVKGTDGTIAINKQVSIDPATPFLIGSSVYPSSVSLTIGSLKLTDSKGELKDPNNTPYASIDYRTGIITWYANATLGFSTVTGSYTPAGQLTRTMQSEVIYVEKTGAGKSYLKTLAATPLAGSMIVSIQVLGKVYTAQDDGKGNLTDTNNQKYGVIDYLNKLINLVLPAIPDSGSAIIFGYQTDLGTRTIQQVANTAGTATSTNVVTAKPVTSFYCADDKILVNGTTAKLGNKTATMSKGKLTGDFTGSYVGSVLLVDGIISQDSKMTIDYKKEIDTTADVSKFLDVTSSNNTFTFNIGKVNPNSVQIYVDVTAGAWVDNNGQSQADIAKWKFILADDGNGNLGISAQNSFDDFKILQVIGQITYATGDCNINLAANSTTPIITAHIKETSLSVITTLRETIYDEKTVATTAKITGLHIQVFAKNGGAGVTNQTIDIAPMGLKIALPVMANAPLVKDSVILGDLHDKQGAILDGQGNQKGTINYATGEITLTDWHNINIDGSNATITTTTAIQPKDTVVNKSIAIDTAVMEYFVPPVLSVIFRTPVAPLKVASVTIYANVIRVTAYSDSTGKTWGEVSKDYTPVAVKPDKDGNFAIIDKWLSEGVEKQTKVLFGKVDWLTGVIEVYSETNIDPTSISYTAMSYRYIPLSSDVIGLDTARLPIDGRVPFVREGDFAVITENQSYVLDNPTPNKAYDIGIERLTSVDITDKTGKAIAPNHVVIDLDTGKFNLTSDFAVSNYSPPLTADYRLADYGVVTQVDISGQITLNMSITHNYTNNAVFSTALINNSDGVVQARAYNVFTQKAWTGVFSDELIGNRATIQFNASAYPIVVTNRSTPTERFAFVLTGTNTFRCIGEILGEIGTGSTLEDFSPINPNSGKPYFVLLKGGWSQGGEINAVMRLNTTAAAPAIWIGSAVQPHQTQSNGVYDFAIEHQANIDRIRGQ